MEHGVLKQPRHEPVFHHATTNERRTHEHRIIHANDTYTWLTRPTSRPLKLDTPIRPRSRIVEINHG